MSFLVQKKSFYKASFFVHIIMDNLQHTSGYKCKQFVHIVCVWLKILLKLLRKQRNLLKFVRGCGILSMLLWYIIQPEIDRNITIIYRKVLNSMKITVCIGSSCHLKGSRQVVEKLQSLVTANSLENKVELAGTFCMGKCVDGVCVTVDDKLFSVSPETAEDFFKNEILAAF